MYLRRLSLSHFRNYRQLEVDFQAPFTLIQGDNAQGKTNLLEAIFMLATSRPIHAQSEREIVEWGASTEPIPYCRITGSIGPQLPGGAEQNGLVNAAASTQEIELILTPRGDGVNFKKQVKINGASRRSIDLIGLMRAVLFMPEDLKLVDGSPGERRRYLDIALCQIDRAYTRALSSYQKVLEQRNSLLKVLREQAMPASAATVEAQLGFWDEKLVEHGSQVIVSRHNFLVQLQPWAERHHAAMSSASERLSLHYLPSFNPGQLNDSEYAFLRDDKAIELLDPPATPLEIQGVAAAYERKLHSRRAREIDAGSTLYGPHRDDLRLVANRRDLRLFGSRGQQRTAALALKLAEVQTMGAMTGNRPILLLDDVMSELDANRRAAMLGALAGVAQAILTTTDWDDFTSEFRSHAQCLRLRAGQLQAGQTWIQTK
jgi:DNA replication and repair protein RecF